jgi:hypothetical protein|tara:strand:+ start:81 stop:542 length:462 start_codon:yes stop_codon:yes gene_type:complete
MKLQVLRFSSESDSTNGLLFDVTEGVKFLAYTLEDEKRDEKVMSETRIPAGTYEVKLRTEGGHHNKYTSRYGSMHKGMLWLQDVPNFKWILIHCGNTDEHTAGCLLVGDSQENNQIKENGFIGSSSNAYKRIYPSIAEAVENEKVTIEYIDID